MSWLYENRKWVSTLAVFFLFCVTFICGVGVVGVNTPAIGDATTGVAESTPTPAAVEPMLTAAAIPTPAPTETPVVETPTPTPEPPVVQAPKPKPKGHGLLAKGARGEKVTELQQQLREMGNPVAVTGEFDGVTESVIRQIQMTAGIDNDGIVGPNTRSALTTALVKARVRAKNTVPTPPAPTPTPVAEVHPTTTTPAPAVDALLFIQHRPKAMPECESSGYPLPTDTGMVSWWVSQQSSWTTDCFLDGDVTPSEGQLTQARDVRRLYSRKISHEAFSASSRPEYERVRAMREVRKSLRPAQMRALSEFDTAMRLTEARANLVTRFAGPDEENEHPDVFSGRQ